MLPSAPAGTQWVPFQSLDAGALVREFSIDAQGNVTVTGREGTLVAGSQFPSTAFEDQRSIWEVDYGDGGFDPGDGQLQPYLYGGIRTRGGAQDTHMALVAA